MYSTEYICSLEKGGAEYKKVMKELRDAHHQKALDDKESLVPHSIH